MGMGLHPWAAMMKMKATTLLMLSALFTLSTGLSSVAHAGLDCGEAAQEAKDEGRHRLVISFEGLAGYALGAVLKSRVVLRAANEGLAPKYFTPSDYSWTNVDAAYECAKAWHDVQGDKMKLVVMGHSFGGSYGVFGLMDKLKEDGIKADVITFDARSGSTDAKFAQTGDRVLFERPSNATSFVNFWETNDIMRGYMVKDAINVQVLDRVHMTVTGDERAYKVFKSIVKGDNSTATIQGILKPKPVDQ